MNKKKINNDIKICRKAIENVMDILYLMEKELMDNVNHKNKNESKNPSETFLEYKYLSKECLCGRPLKTNEEVILGVCENCR